MNANATDDRELLRTLAEATGWTCTLGSVFTTDGYWVTDKEDSVRGASFGHTPDEAWQHAEFPDWLHSVDAALSLPWPENSEQIVAWQGPKSPGAVLLLGKLGSGKEYHSHSQTTLARALCECFAQWWNEKEAKP